MTTKIADDGLSCCICVSKYDLKDHLPQILPCFHTFCSSCLPQLPVVNHRVKCPTCQRDFLASKWNLNYALVNALQYAQSDEKKSTAKHSCICDEPPVYFCVPCELYLCTSDAQRHMKAKSGHKLEPLSEASVPISLLEPVQCPMHKLEYRYICKRDNELICGDCLATEHSNHKDHGTPELVSTRYEAEKKAVDRVLGAAGVDGKQVKKAAEKILGAEAGLETRLNELKQEINAKFTKLHDILIKRQETLTKDLTILINTKRKALRKQSDNLYNQYQQLQITASHLKQLLSSASSAPSRIFLLRRQLEAQLSSFTLYSLTPCVFTDLVVEVDERYERSLANTGKIVDRSLTSPRYSLIRRADVEIEVDRKQATFVIQAKTGVGLDQKQGGDTWEFRLQGKIFHPTVIDEKNGLYTVTYPVPDWMDEKGYEISVFFMGEQIQGSPFTVRRWRCVEGVSIGGFGVSGTKRGHFKKPAGIAMSRKNHYLYICDVDNHRVQILDKKGNYISSFGSYGHEKSQLHHPWYIATDDDEVFISERYNRRLQIVDLDGNHKRLLKLGYEPGGVVIRENQIFVTNYSNHQICIYSRQGDLIRQWGSQGSGHGQLNHPADLCTDSKFVYVADCFNHRIEVYNMNGVWVRTIGKHGDKVGELNCPRSIKNYQEGLYVGDGSGRVNVFEKEANWVKEVKNSKSKDGKFEGAIYGIMVEQRQLYVVDYERDKVWMFR